MNNHEYIFCIADVSGKGIAAALLMSNIQATLHSLITYTHDLKDIVIQLNKRVIQNAKSEKFVSLFIAKLNTKSQQFSYINAGHNVPILTYENKFMELNKGCPLLGINETLVQIDSGTFDYTSEFTVICYTDGLTDTYNFQNETMSIEALQEIMAKNKDASPEFLNKAILFYAEEFKGENEFPDDIALLTVKVSDLHF